MCARDAPFRSHNASCLNKTTSTGLKTELNLMNRLLITPQLRYLRSWFFSEFWELMFC